MANGTYVETTDILTAEQLLVSAGGRELLKGATIRAVRGSVTGLLGRNGSGKSTMLRCVYGTRAAEQCDVFVNGVRVQDAYTCPGLINYLPQHSFIPYSLKIRKVLQHYGISQERVLHYFPELEVQMNLTVRALSGGQERLLSVLVILLADTRFSLLDEPFSQLMPLHVERLMSLLQVQKQKKGIIITDHQYRSLLEVSDTVYMLKEGQSLYIRDREDLVLHGYLSSLEYV